VIEEFPMPNGTDELEPAKPAERQFSRISRWFLVRSGVALTLIILSMALAGFFGWQSVKVGVAQARALVQFKPLDLPDPESTAELEKFKTDQVRKLKSLESLSRLVNDPQIAGLPSIANDPNAVDTLSRTLKIDVLAPGLASVSFTHQDPVVGKLLTDRLLELHRRDNQAQGGPQRFEILEEAVIFNNQSARLRMILAAGAALTTGVLLLLGFALLEGILFLLFQSPVKNANPNAIL
jgi:hypothetical protein